jgi:hypothetical protein
MKIFTFLSKNKLKILKLSLISTITPPFCFVGR